MQDTAKEYCDLLKKIIEEQPSNVAARNNLGSAYFTQKKWADAIEQFRIVIAQSPDYIDARYNLGLTLMKQSSIDEAVTAWQELIARSPNHQAARFHLACCYMAKNNYQEAEIIFRDILEKRPTHAESHFNLATCYLKQGSLKEARKHYQEATELDPQDPQALFNLGVIATELNELDFAIRHYQKALQLDPHFFAAHYNVAIAFMTIGRAEFALDHLFAAQKIQPDNNNVAYLIEMLQQHKKPTGAPKEYISTLFDAYADHYEQHLMTALDYVLPTLFVDALKKCSILKPHSLDILDLGCGTGLCSASLKPFAKSLHGVDLSEKMLEIAREKNIFDSLTQNDIESFLKDKKNRYDLIVAGDVLVYCGQLDTIFSAVYQALRHQGYFIFNTEVTTEKEYQMNQSGRFGHSKNYIESLAKQFHFDMLYFKDIASRLQNNEPVKGYLVVLRKN